MTTQPFGKLLSDARTRKGITQLDMARALGMTRGNYGHIESGRRRDPLTPAQARIVSEMLGIGMLRLADSMGYTIEVEGFESITEMELLDAYQKQDPDIQRRMRKFMEPLDA